MANSFDVNKTVNTEFAQDVYPGKPKVLFIGHGSSTHTLAWIDLLADTEINVRLFCLPGTYPPDYWPTRAYIVLPTEQIPSGCDAERRESFHLLPYQLRQLEIERKNLEIELKNKMDMKMKAVKRNLLYWLIVVLKKVFNYISSTQLAVQLESPNHIDYPTVQTKASTPQAWLADIIQTWHPDIIHTFGLDGAGSFYFETRNQFQLDNIGKWILQLRGGSDLTLARFDEQRLPTITNIVEQAHEIISDNRVNFDYIKDIGVNSEKIASISPLPGTGGIDVQKLASSWQGDPSERRMIVWPKAYDCEWSVALPVFEAIRLVWDRIQPCSIYMFVMVTEGTRMWYNTLPPEIRRHCHVFNRVPRDELLTLLPQARVMLAPSLVDGVPNTMYEAMACGAFPIVSPLDTIVPVVQNEKNVLFARNLYPDEIAKALVRAMNDDELVCNAGKLNLELVKKLADRSVLAPRVAAYYERLAKQP
jgi:hypothetical protein